MGIVQPETAGRGSSTRAGRLRRGFLGRAALGNGDRLVEPCDHGTTTFGEHSAYERGYVAKYAIRGYRLFLQELDINLGSEKPKLHGSVASGPSTCHDLFDSHYLNIHMPILYTGGLLIGSRFVDELYVPMGFQPAWKYEEVHELQFEAGRLDATKGVSEKMREFREDMRGCALRPDREVRMKDRVKWIDQCFSRTYTL